MVGKDVGPGGSAGEGTSIKGSARLLWLDGLVNLVLGALLIPFPRQVVEFLGVPTTNVVFYPSILGAVFVGIGLGLVKQARMRPCEACGFGLGGAMAINLCGGGALAAWLLWGRLSLPVRGVLFLWGLVAFLAAISILEWSLARRSRQAFRGGEGA